MIITCFCIAPTSVAKADVSIPLQPTINILLMYDESYDDVLQQYGLTHEQIVKRFDEIGRLIRYPYYDTFGISLNFTVSDYSSYLGDEYAMQCPVGNGLRTYVSSIAGDETNGLVRPQVGGYYTPENIPEGFVVESVVIDSTGTSFFIVPADGNYVTSNDPASVALYNTSIRRVYDQYPLVNYITDQPAYAARLASDIGATPTGNQINGHPTYLGNVEVYVPEMNSSSNIVVGSQFIFINNRGLAEYRYSPLGIDFANQSIGNGLADSITLEFHAFNTAHSDVIE